MISNFLVTVGLVMCVLCGGLVFSVVTSITRGVAKNWNSTNINEEDTIGG